MIRLNNPRVPEVLSLWSLAALLHHLVTGEPILPTSLAGRLETDTLSSAFNSQEKPAVHLGC